ncbi:MAG TPA: class I SAM-dependent methyltransferase [Thermoanaerobaculia bacterium]
MLRRSLSDLLVRHVRQHPRLENRLRSLVLRASPARTVLLEYPVYASPRWGNGKPRHAALHEILNRERPIYETMARRFREYARDLAQVPTNADAGSSEPSWNNPMLPSLDAIALYTLLCDKNPKRYFEVGSGNSTLFARRAVRDHRLKTEILSIDPEPRAEINALCDRTVRSPVETVGLELFDELEAGDILFIDNSHRIFMNSDATVVFLDILPRLKPGILVHFHDIFLPFDYPSDWVDRYYSEQYLLAAYLLAGGDAFRVLWAANFVSGDERLSAMIAPVWEEIGTAPGERHGVSFWIETT